MSAGRDFTSTPQIKTAHGSISSWRTPWWKSRRKMEENVSTNLDKISLTNKPGKFTLDFHTVLTAPINAD